MGVSYELQLFEEQHWISPRGIGSAAWYVSCWQGHSFHTRALLFKSVNSGLIQGSIWNQSLISWIQEA